MTKLLDAPRPAPAGDNVSRPAAFNMREWAANNINLVCAGCEAPRPWSRHFGQCRSCGVDCGPKGATARDQHAWERWLKWLRSPDYTPLPRPLELVQPRKRRRRGEAS